MHITATRARARPHTDKLVACDERYTEGEELALIILFGINRTDLLFTICFEEDCDAAKTIDIMREMSRKCHA